MLSPSRGKKLLHQPFFMALERAKPAGFGGEQVVEGREAGGDFLLLFQLGKSDWKREKRISMDTSRLSAAVRSFAQPLVKVLSLNIFEQEHRIKPGSDIETRQIDR